VRCCGRMSCQGAASAGRRPASVLLLGALRSARGMGRVVGRMRAKGAAAIAAGLLLGIAGCGTGTAAVMPAVTGKKLDVAEKAIGDAGIRGEVEIDGGGLFGVVDKSNWEVCRQRPAAGEVATTNPPQLTVKRSCDEEESPGTGQATSAPKTAEASEPATESILTRSSSPELAALLAVPDYCDETIASFAAAYGGRTIAFDGSIVHLARHGDANTRYDILVAPGDKGPTSTVGPAFKFEDVNVFDLNVTGNDIPDSVAEGDRFRFRVRVGRYESRQCLLFLEPISARVR
jgi:Domain of unknown function (DUF4839)